MPPPLDPSRPLYLGIDGGGSTCRARLAAHDGRRIAEATGGPANISADPDGALAAIAATIRAVLAAADFSETAAPRIRLGLGLAGAAAPSAAATIARLPLPFAAVTLATDAEIARLGAHGGGDGAILILGTGSHGLARIDGRDHRVGGWGRALSDDGSGAVVGQQAARRALLAHESVLPGSPFTQALMARFANDPPTMLAFALKARPRDWADLAPLVFDHAGNGDPVALALRADAVAAVAAIADRLAALGARRIALVGGLAGAYRPHLPARLGALLVEPAGDALDGALRLAGLAVVTAPPGAPSPTS